MGDKGKAKERQEKHRPAEGREAAKAANKSEGGGAEAEALTNEQSENERNLGGGEIGFVWAKRQGKGELITDQRPE